MNHLYPLKLSYVTKSPLWGGTRLLDRWGIEAPANQSTIGEAWMLTVREKDMSVIQTGALAGMSMREYIDTYGNGVVGSSAKVEASLLKMPTPPCKLADNHKVINLSATHSVTAWLVEQPCV